MARYVSSYFSPDRGTADIIVGFISKCQKTLDVAIYSLTHDKITEALLDAHSRGVKVRVLIDKTQAGNRYADDEKLLDAGIPLLRDRVPGLMHNKFVIGDGKAVGTGSFNWSKSADEKNAENFVIIRLSYVVRQFQQEFEKLWKKSL